MMDMEGYRRFPCFICVSAATQTCLIFCFPSLFQLYINRICYYFITLQVLLNHFGPFTATCQHGRMVSARTSPQLLLGQRHARWLAYFWSWSYWNEQHLCCTSETLAPSPKVHSGKPDCLQNICDHHQSSAEQWWAYMGTLLGAKLISTPFTFCTLNTAAE